MTAYTNSDSKASTVQLALSSRVRSETASDQNYNSSAGACISTASRKFKNFKKKIYKIALAVNLST